MHDRQRNLFLRGDFFNKNFDKEMEKIHKDFEKRILGIINHPKLNQYYQNDLISFNEREIIANNGSIFIPDRLVFLKNNNVVIIDFKTGIALKKYKKQLNNCLLYTSDAADEV